MSVVSIPALLTEQQAAEKLGISIYTLQRIRKRREISFISIGRKAKYSEHHLAEYREAQTCHAERKPAQTRSADIGSPNAEIRRTGAEPGITTQGARHAAQALAKQILSAPN
jgi:helix-turn-helix protein